MLKYRAMYVNPNCHMKKYILLLKGHGGRANEVFSSSRRRDDKQQVTPFYGRRPQRITERITD